MNWIWYWTKAKVTIIWTHPPAKFLSLNYVRYGLSLIWLWCIYDSYITKNGIYTLPWKCKYILIKSLSPLDLVWIDTRRLTQLSVSMFFLCYSCTNMMIKNMSFYITWYIIPWKYKYKLPRRKFGAIVSSVNWHTRKFTFINIISVLL